MRGAERIVAAALYDHPGGTELRVYFEPEDRDDVLQRGALGHDRAEFLFDEPQQAITPGQAMVFYDGDLIVGDGWID